MLEVRPNLFLVACVGDTVPNRDLLIKRESLVDELRREQGVARSGEESCERLPKRFTRAKEMSQKNDASLGSVITEIAIALPVPLTRTTAASLPGPTMVLVRTVLSYWRYTQRLLATLGAASSVFRVSPSVDGAGSEEMSSDAAGFTGSTHGRSYTGASSVSAVVGTSACSLPPWKTFTRPSPVASVSAM